MTANRVKAMMSPLRYLALFVIAAGLLPAAGAQAQHYGATRQPAPLYPYAVQNSYGVQYPSSVADQRNAVEVAPNTYMSQRPAAARAYPYVGRRHGHAASEPKAPALDRPHKKIDRALIEQLRKRAPVKRTVINTKRIVHAAPVVAQRVIKADAEITILGPDRMSIRLFRKGQGPKASARAE